MSQRIQGFLWSTAACLTMYFFGFYIGKGSVTSSTASKCPTINLAADIQPCVGSATTTGDNSAAVTGSGNTITWNGKREPAHVPYKEGMTLLPGQSTSAIIDGNTVNGIGTGTHRWPNKVSQVSNGANSPNISGATGDVVISYPKESK